MTTLHKGSDIKGGPGHEIRETGAVWKNRPDCPACKHGTLMPVEAKPEMRCIDCGRVFTTAGLIARKIIRVGEQ